MQVSAIGHQVGQTIIVNLSSPRPVKRESVPKYAKGHVLRQGPLVLDYMAQGLHQKEIADLMGVTLTTVQAYASQYRRAKREGLV